MDHLLAHTDLVAIWGMGLGAFALGFASACGILLRRRGSDKA
ncbi:MAG: hypothetical protein ACOCTI_02305 [Phycisphaeraceae bacterium]